MTGIPDNLRAIADDGHARAAAAVDRLSRAADHLELVCDGRVPAIDMAEREAERALIYAARDMLATASDPIAAAVATIDALPADDPATTRGAVEDVLLEFAPRAVREAAVRAAIRCGGWA